MEVKLLAFLNYDFYISEYLVLVCASLLYTCIAACEQACSQEAVGMVDVGKMMHPL